MKNPCILGSLCAALIFAPHSIAQTNSTPPPPASDEVVNLPAFTVKSTKDNSYVGKEALSTTRVATDLADLPQTVTVFNRSFIEAVNPFNLSDLLNYAGGGQTGTLNWTSGRLIIRGFVSDGDFVDGFNPETASTVDMALYDRVEIIKGPSAIFNASSPPGGLVNKITKSPTSYDLRTVKVQVGTFDANRVEVDLSGPIDKAGHLLYRVVAAEQYSEGYYDSTYMRRFVIAPMMTYQFSPETQLTLKYFYVNTEFPSYNGLPLDPRTLKPFDVPDTRNLSEDEPSNWRTDLISRATMEFTSRLSDFLVFRLAAMGSWEEAERVESVTTTWSDGSRSFIPNYTGGPVNRSTTAETVDNPRHAIQNDYNFNFKTGPVDNNLLVGGELTSAPVSRWAYPGTSSPVNPFVITPPTVTVNYATPSANTRSTSTSAKMFAHETAKFLSDRLLLSGGLSRIRVSNSQFNNLTNAYSQNEYVVYQNLKQYGIVVKPLPKISLFYGYNEGFAANAPAGGAPVPPRLAQQKETGVKSSFLNDRLNVSVSYFEAKQTNNSVPSFPFNGTNVLIPGVVSRGFDGEFSFEATKNFYLMGSFADYNAYAPSQPSNATFPQPGNGQIMSQIPVDNVAEQTFSLFGRYAFTGKLKGLDVSLGGEYQSKRAVTDNANQTFFGYIPSRTLVNAYINYRVGKIRYSMNIDNVLNTDYVYSARSVNVVIPGTPINVKVAVAYSF